MWKIAIERGPAAALWLLALAAQLSGYTSIAIAFAAAGAAALLLIAPAIHHLRAWRDRTGRKMTTAQFLLLIGIAGTWIFMNIAMGTASWMIFNSQPLTANAAAITADPDQGPVLWFRNLILEGGPNSNMPVYALIFNGRNISSKEVQIKSANIISSINGTKLDLEIVAQNEIVRLDEIELVPPGAQIQLVAKFGEPRADDPRKVLGLAAKDFIDTWRSFSLNVEDSKRNYRISFNEGDLAAFFPGRVGPHVSKKATSKGL